MATYTSADLPPNPIQGTVGADIVDIEVVSTHLTIDLSTWTFEDWDPEIDYVFIDGSGRAEALSLTGSTERDVIAGGQGSDEIDAGDGDDTVIGFTEGDVVDGGSGFDTLALAVSTIIADNDALSGVEAVTAADADDGVVLDLGGQVEGFAITGSAFADTITGGQGEDEIDAGDGDDTIVGFTEGDIVDGGDGNDTLVLAATSLGLNAAGDGQVIAIEAVSAASAEAGVVLDLGGQVEGFAITGSAFADTITGGQGADEIDAGDGDDTVVGFTTGDSVDGGDGTDTLVLAVSTTIADDEALVDVEAVTAAEAEDGVVLDLGGQEEGFAITGSGYADTITGGQGEDEIDAGDGDDTIIGFTEGDIVDGGDGADTLVLKATSLGLNAAGDEQIIAIETVSAASAEAGVILDLGDQEEGFAITGSAFADTITGGQGADDIDAGDDDDTIIGFTAGDSVDGGDGTDTLVLKATSLGLNAAGDEQVKAIEIVSAASAEAGVILDLGNQSDGFQIVGSVHADTIVGSSAADEIDAGDDDDTIIGFTEGDIVDGGDGADTLVLKATSLGLNAAGDEQVKAIEIVSAASAESGVTIDLGNQSDGFQIVGSVHADTIVGSSAADDIDAGDGDDTIIGFTTGDNIDGGDGTDTLVLAVSTTIADDDALTNVETVSAASAEAGVILDLGGQEEGFAITGSVFADTLTGGQGADDIDAGDGDDTIIGFTTGDIVDGGGGFDTLALAATSASLNAAADNTLVDIERVSATSATAAVVIDLSRQSDGFEIIGGSFGDTITGSSAGDMIWGGAGDDTIVGFVGADRIDGGSGVNTLVLDATSSWLNIAADGDLVNVAVVAAQAATAPITIDLGRQGEGFTIAGGIFADIITGGQGADAIDAGSGDDVIVGFVGADRIDGGAGNDTLVLAATSASLNAAADADLVAIETVSAAGAIAGIAIDLSAQGEGFAILGGGFGDVLTGSAGADRIEGGAGDDILAGGFGVDVVRGGDGSDIIRATAGDGNDVYDGGGGGDTVDYSATSAGVKVDLTAEDRSSQSVGDDPGSMAALLSAAGLGSGTPVGIATGDQTGVDVMTGIENVIGSLGSDTIFGDGWANRFEGLAGGDRIWGRGGDDTIRGGDGDDVLVGDFGGSGGGSGNDALFGDAGDDQLYGEDGNDVLSGGLGSDQYAGGAGSDLLVFEKDRASDTAWGGAGRDIFRFEKGFGKDRIKDFLATGSSSDKIDLSAFKGLKFSKLKIKQKDADVQIKSKKFAKGDKITLEVVNAGALNKKDFIFSKKKKKANADSDHKSKTKNHADMLEGTSGDDVLDGGKGADTLIGGKGADLLTGGSGRDTFVFKSADDGMDTITDFKSGKDRLDISADGFGGGLHAGDAVTLVALADIASHVGVSQDGVFLFVTAGHERGTIYWDANGGASADAVAIARINSDILFASDFQVT